MAGPISSPQLSSSISSNKEAQASAVAPEEEPWAIFHRSLQVGMTQLDAEYEPLLKQKKQEERKALSDEIKEAIGKGANIEFSLEEADEKAAEEIAAYKRKFLAIAEACFKKALNQPAGAQISSLDLQLCDGLTHQVVELSERMASMEIAHDEKISLLEAEKQALKAELESVRPPVVEKIDRASSPIIPEKRVKYLGKIIPPVELEACLLNPSSKKRLLSPDGKWAVMADIKKADAIFLFNTTDHLLHKEKFSFGEPEASPLVQAYKNEDFHTFFISLNNQYLVSSATNVAFIWQLSEPNEPPLVLERPEYISSSYLKAISSDKRWLVYQLGDDGFKLIERKEENPRIRTLQGKRNISPVFLLNNQWIASGGENTVYLYLVNSQNEQSEVELDFEGKQIEELITSSDGASLAVTYSYGVNGERCVATRLYKVDAILEHGARALYFEFGDKYTDTHITVLSHDGKWFACVDCARDDIDIWFIGSHRRRLITTFKFEAFEPVPRDFDNIAWQQDGNDLALVVNDGDHYWRYSLSDEERAIETDPSLDGDHDN